MTWVLQLDPAAVASGRTMFDLNSGAIRVDEAGIDWGDAAIAAFTAELAMGSSIVDFRIPNRIVTIPLGIGVDDSGAGETVRAQLQEKVGLLQREGGWLLRQRSGGPAMYADIVSATLTLPDVYGETAGGTELGVKLVLECLPDFYGDEITLDVVNGTGSVASVLQQASAQAVIKGDYPARCRIIVTDTSGNDQHGLLWGVRSRHYDAASTAALIYEGEALDAVFGSSAVSALAGASGGQVMRNGSVSSVAWSSVALMEIGLSSSFLTHIGTYRVFARVYTTTTPPVQVRLRWSPTPSIAAADTVTNDPATVPIASNFYVVDLGQISLRSLPAPFTQSAWNGLIEAQVGTGTGNLSVDQVYLQPIDESAGKVMDPDRAVLFASQYAELQTDAMLMTYGLADARLDGKDVLVPQKQVIGDLPRLPPSGVEGRPVEIFVKPTRSDLATTADGGLDSFIVQVKYRPCYLSRP